MPLDSTYKLYDHVTRLGYAIDCGKLSQEKTPMSHSARYERGLAKFVEMYGERTKVFLASLEGIAPDLGKYVMEFGFGDIHSRPGLSLQSREIATVAALTALGTAGPQLRAHIDGALNVGCTEQEVVEVIMQMALYAGISSSAQRDSSCAGSVPGADQTEMSGSPSKSWMPGIGRQFTTSILSFL